MKKNIQFSDLETEISKALIHGTEDAQYPVWLEICRKSNISSYSLQVLIDYCSKKKKGLKQSSEAPLIRFISYEELQEKEQVVSREITPKEIKPVAKEIVKIKTIETVIYKWGWKTWSLFVVFIGLFGFIIYRIFSSPILQKEMFGKILL